MSISLSSHWVLNFIINYLILNHNTFTVNNRYIKYKLEENIFLATMYKVYLTLRSSLNG